MSFNKYFQSYQNYFWQWETEENLLSIPNGNTIAYVEYMSEVMDILSMQGLPTFGALLLTVIATNPQGEESIDIIDQKIQAIFTKSFELKLSLDNGSSTSAYKNFLTTLSSLPEELKTGKNRLLLFQTIFQASHNHISLSKSKILASEIKRRAIPKECYNKDTITIPTLQLDLKPLAILDKKYPTVNSILNAISAIKEIQELEIETENKVPEKDSYIDELLDNPKTFHVGALIKSLWGGLNIPLHYNTPSQQPLGGVSDISNKGDFDKLLISEFANDDVIFLSRLANNEALYINREVPPSKDNLNRIILIDISLHNWGNPKTIAFAIMLALAKHPKNKITCIPYVVGDSYYPIEYDTVIKLINSLEILEPCLFPVKGLAQFFEKTASSNNEVIFITSRDTTKHPEMKAVINQYRNKINYMAYVDSWGKIELFRMLKNSKKHLQSLSIDLDDIWKNSKESKNTDEHINQYSEPHQFPLLFMPKNSTHGLMKLGADYYYMEKNLLMKNVSLDKGWKIVYDKINILPSACQIGQNLDGDFLLLACFNSNKKMELHNLNTGEIKSKPYSKLHFTKNSLSFFFGNFYALDNRGKLNKVNWDLSLAEVLNREEIENYINAENKKIGIESSKLLNRKSVLFNVKDISILENWTILINNRHVLKIDNLPAGDISIKLLPYFRNKEKIKEYAMRISENRFKLKNGMEIENHQGILKFMLKDEKTIYIPLAIDMPLAIAVDNIAMGNPYFYTDEMAQAVKSKESLITEAIDLLKSEDTWN